MEEIVKIDSVAQYNAMRGASTFHPLITVLDLSMAKPMPAQTFHFGLYALFLKELKCGEIRYGRSYYDFQEGTLVCIGPGQVVQIQVQTQTFEPKGWVLLFHPDLIKGTHLGKHIHEYSFFSYDVNEALHLSDREKQMVLELFKKIQFEIEQPIDKHSKTVITSHIELFLNYCDRFYDRQFITRDQAHKSILSKFEHLLQAYFASDKPQKIGLPSVAYCADELHLSPNYFGDLIKKETGISAQEYIQTKVIDMAKALIFDPEMSISTVAYDLGFKYPQHFTRLFKQKVGLSPIAYRSQMMMEN